MSLKRWMNLASRPFARREDREKGMTIIEILIVIGLIGTLMGIIMTTLIERGDDAKVDLAKVAMGQLESGLRLYKMHNNRYPTTEEGLQALVTAPAGAKNWRGPYSEAEKLNDPWDVPFGYEASGARSFKIISGGPDGQIGAGDDDITYPEDKSGGGTAPAE
jgi:general secretion pathway protein G